MGGDNGVQGFFVLWVLLVVDMVALVTVGAYEAVASTNRRCPFESRQWEEPSPDEDYWTWYRRQLKDLANEIANRRKNLLAGRYDKYGVKWKAWLRQRHSEIDLLHCYWTDFESCVKGLYSNAIPEGIFYQLTGEHWQNGWEARALEQAL